MFKKLYSLSVILFFTIALFQCQRITKPSKVACMNQTMKIAEIDLKCIIRENPKGNIILMHGYGANADDLFSLGEMLDQTGDYNWYFPEGVITLGKYGPNFIARAWFNIDLEVLQSSNPRNYVNVTPPGFLEAAKKLSAMLTQLKLDTSKTILGGFSQGSMMATELALASPQPLAGLLILSGTLLNKERWQQMAQQLGFEIPFFQSHGRNDSLLSFKIAEELNQVLNQGKIKGKLLSFDGAHEIPFSALQGMLNFIHEKLP